MGEPLSLDEPCRFCERPIGDHTLREQQKCFEPLNYALAYEDVPDGPIVFPGIEGDVVGEFTIKPGFVDTALGRLPILQMGFVGVGAEPGSRRPLKPIVLLMDATGLKHFRSMVATAVDRAIVAARRGR